MSRFLDGIRAVAFDAVGTLIFPNPGAATVYAEAAGRHGIAANPASDFACPKTGVSLFPNRKIITKLVATNTSRVARLRINFLLSKSQTRGRERVNRTTGIRDWPCRNPDGEFQILISHFGLHFRAVRKTIRPLTTCVNK